MRIIIFYTLLKHDRTQMHCGHKHVCVRRMSGMKQLNNSNGGSDNNNNNRIIMVMMMIVVTSATTAVVVY